MQKIDYIISGDYVLTMNDKMDVIKNGAVAIKNQKIIDVDTIDNINEKFSATKNLRKKDHVIMPGLINTHNHAPMVHLRGIADDLPLKVWLEEHIWPAEKKWLTPDYVHDATELACLEMIQNGTTTYANMYFYEDKMARATKKIGMRAILAPTIFDFPTVVANTIGEYLDDATKFINNWKNDELITPAIGPHAPYTCSTETLQKTKAIAEKFDIPILTHLSETQWEVGEILSRYGKRPTEYLDTIGFLDERVLLAHCVWPDDKGIEILAKRKVGVSHCIESNLKLACGIAPIPKMLKAGVKVSFGTDGAASNNDANMLSEISTAAKVHKMASQDPTTLDAKTALLMATKMGAAAINMEDRIGSLQKGYLADLITINFHKPHLIPMYDVYSAIVYAAQASDIENVMINGKMIMEDRELVTGEEDRILAKALEWGKKIRG